MASSIITSTRGYEGILDRDKFEKELHEVFNKAISVTEAPAKEKHVRNIVIATWKEKGAISFWRVVRQFPLLRSQIVCWKACFVVHRSFRDGYKDVTKKSASEMRFLSELGKHWSHAGAGYAPLNTAYVRVLMNRISFIVKNPEIPANFNFEDEPFQVPTEIDDVFNLAVEVFDMQSSLLHFYVAVLNNLDPSRGQGVNVIQCLLAPLIPAIQDSASIYDVVFKLMKALHSALPADTLEGHRQRFNRQYLALRKYFLEASKMEYIISRVTIPSLDPDPPSFLLPGQLIEYELARQVHTITQADEESSITSIPARQTTTPEKTTPKRSDVFEAEFGSSEFGEGFDFTSQPPPTPKRDDRDSLIEQLMKELVDLKEKISELVSQRSADHLLIAGLRERLAQIEAELNDYKEIAEQTCNENVLLKRQIEASATEKGGQAEVEERAKSAEEKFKKLREVYQKLRTEHITLLRRNGETQQQFVTATQTITEGEDKRKELDQKSISLMMEVEELKVHANDESAQVTLLRDELRRKEAQSVQLEQTQHSLSEQLLAKEKEAPHSLLVSAVEESQTIIRRILEEIQGPSITGITCTPTFLLEHTKGSLDVVDSAVSAFSLYNNDPQSLGKALSVVPSISHSLGDIMLQGVATAQLAPTEDGQKLVKGSQSIGESALEFLEVLKKEKPGSSTIAMSANNLQKSIRNLERMATELIEEKVEDEATSDRLGDIVDEELSATASAVESATRRIQDMLHKSREDDSGVKLEVNERILDSCTDLMKAIKILIARSKDLQAEIINEGMSTMTNSNEFYQKNSRWSEGLISAAKQVGWGATLLVDSADKVVTRTGKFEELVVASHNIAASTAQLVAASRVKARPKSENLKTLKASSRAVSEATGQVVASTQTGQDLQKQDSELKMDYSKLSLTQAKRLEMESQVKALELEKELETERIRLAELRKVHYHIAGASEGWEEENQ